MAKDQTIDFIASLIGYTAQFIVLIGVVVGAVFFGMYLRKRKNKKEQAKKEM